jgi:ubiquinone/menaquinone biosynthesis C-methylase UbiE
MLKKAANNQNEQSLAVRLRRKRFAFFQSLLDGLERPVHILDIGGTEDYWKMMKLDMQKDVFITLLNLTQETTALPNVKSIAGDARRLRFADLSFDVVYSNSVIEHVGSRLDQEQMAAEVRRVGKRYFIQTPNKNFPLEPHFLFPFFQFLPHKLRIVLLQNFNLGWFPKIADAAKAKEIVESIVLLNRKEFASMFPSASIYDEKLLGMTKSFVAFGGWDLG